MKQPKEPQNILASKLFRELWTFRFHARLGIVLSAFISTVFGIMSPFFQKEFIDSLMGISTKFHDIFSAQPLILLLLAFVCLLLAAVFTQLTNYLGAREAVLLQQVWAKRLYNKILSLRNDTLSQRPVGEIVSIYATDVPSATVILDQSLPVGMAMLFPLILGPMAVYFLFEIPLAPLLAVMILHFCLSAFMAYRQSKYFSQFKTLAAKRIGLVSEWIQNIRTLRILSWVEPFEQKIFQTRKIETRNRVTMVTNGQSMNAIATSATFIINTVTLASILYIANREVTTGELLSLLWIIGIFLTRPFRQLPWMFTFLFDGWTSLKRLEAILDTRNIEHQKRSHQNLQVNDSQSPALEVQNLNLKIGHKTILDNISFKAKQGEFIAIVGEVGSGKSMLLYSLMGESGATFEKYLIGSFDGAHAPIAQLKSFFSFVAQEGFIMNSTLRDNVAFDYDANHSLDSQILNSLKLAQFDLSIEKITGGLGSEIGERGVNLSGGQKQRVSLARVNYHKAPIILMDDCLSAVDVDTENKLIESLLDGEWKNSTRILATHRLTVLNKVDRILFLEAGRIIDSGSFHELLTRSTAFQNYVESITTPNEPDEAEINYVQ